MEEQEKQLCIGTCDAEENGALWYADWDEEKGIPGKFIRCGDSGASVFLCADEKKGRLYAVVNRKQQVFLDLFSPGADGPILQCRTEVKGSGLAYVDILSDPDALLCAFYSSGTVCAFQRKADGKIGDCLTMVVYSGSGPVRDRQEASHVHSVVISDDQTRAIAADLGADALYLFHIKKDGGLREYSHTVVAPGSGPRYTVFSRDGHHLYLVNELSNTLCHYVISGNRGEASLCESFPLIPESFPGSCAAGDLHLSSDGLDLYVSLRGMNRIAAFRIGENGTPQKNGYYETGGAWCNSFVLSPKEKWLVAANYETGNLCVMQRGQDGTLGPVKNSAMLPYPMCVRFFRGKL